MASVRNMYNLETLGRQKQCQQTGSQQSVCYRMAIVVTPTDDIPHRCDVKTSSGSPSGGDSLVVDVSMTSPRLSADGPTVRSSPSPQPATSSRLSCSSTSSASSCPAAGITVEELDSGCSGGGGSDLRHGASASKTSTVAFDAGGPNVRLEFVVTPSGEGSTFNDVLTQSEDSSAVGGDELPLTLDLPPCHEARCRLPTEARYANSSRYGHLVHPLDRGLFLSFTLSIVYLVAAIVSFCPTFFIVVVVVPLAIILRRLAVALYRWWTAGRGGAVDGEEGGGDAAASDGIGTMLTGHEEFWVGHRSAVTQCLVTFDGRLTADELRQLLQVRLFSEEHPVSGRNGSHDSRPPPPPHSSPCCRLAQKVVRRLVGHWWVVDTQFSVANHVLDAPDGVAQSAEQVRHFVADMSARPLSWDRPLWELHVIAPPSSTSSTSSSRGGVSAGGYDVTLALLRTHPCVADGTKLARLLCFRLADSDVISGWRPTARCHYGRLAYSFNIIRAMFVGLLLLLKKALTFNDHNLLHGPRLSGVRAVSWSRPLNMSSVLRVKDVTRSTLNDLLLSVLSGCLRHYLLRAGVSNPRDLTATLLVDLQPPSAAACFGGAGGGGGGSSADDGSARQSCRPPPLTTLSPQSSNNGRDGPYGVGQRLSVPGDCLASAGSTSSAGIWTSASSAGAAAAATAGPSGAASPPCSSNGVAPHTNGGHSAPVGSRAATFSHHRRHCDVSADVKLSLVDVVLPTNTEGAIPRLWDIKQRMNEVKSSADHVILYACQSILQYILPGCVRRRLWRLFYARSTLIVSNLPGPDYGLSVAGRPVRDIMVWFPILDEAAVSVSFVTYAGQLYMTISADSGVLPDPDFLTTKFVAEMQMLAKLLANRRIPGEHSPHRRSDRSLVTTTTREPDIHEVQARILEVQKQLQELEASLEMDPDQEMSDDEARLVEQLESLKIEFGEMLFELRHKLNVHVSADADDDDYDDDGDLRPQYRRLSLHSAAVSSRGLLSAVSARILHVPPNSPPPVHGSPGGGVDSVTPVPGRRRRLSSAAVVDAFQRRYHSFHSAAPRPNSRARLSLDVGLTAARPPPDMT